MWVAALPNASSGKAYFGSDLVPDSQFLKSEIYNEFGKCYYDFCHMLGGCINVGGSLAWTGLHRPTMASNFGEAERRRYQRLIPHLQRSLEIRQRFRAQADQTLLLQGAIDQLSLGLIVVDASCRPLLMNRMAEICLGTGNGLLGGSPKRPLRTEVTTETSRLHRLVTEVTSQPRMPGGALKVTRTSERPALLLLVAPLVNRKLLCAGFKEPAALILIRDPAQNATPRPRVLTDLFGLTDAEVAVAEGLTANMELSEIAESRGSAISTLRTQLKSVLRKTDCDRQASLVRLLTILDQGSQ